MLKSSQEKNRRLLRVAHGDDAAGGGFGLVHGLVGRVDEFGDGGLLGGHGDADAAVTVIGG